MRKCMCRAWRPGAPAGDGRGGGCNGGGNGRRGASWRGGCPPAPANLPSPAGGVRRICGRITRRLRLHLKPPPPPPPPHEQRRHRPRQARSLLEVIALNPGPDGVVATSSTFPPPAPRTTCSLSLLEPLPPRVRQRRYH